MNSNGISGKVIVITGASSGLGEAAARLLAAEGAAVVLGARRVDRIRSLADELSANGAKALALATDVTNPEEVKALVDAAVQQFGRIDVMINNAGLMPHSPLERLKIEDWNRTIDVNIKGVLYGTRANLATCRREPQSSSGTLRSPKHSCEPWTASTPLSLPLARMEQAKRGRKLWTTVECETFSKPSGQDRPASF